MAKPCSGASSTAPLWLASDKCGEALLLRTLHNVDYRNYAYLNGKAFRRRNLYPVRGIRHPYLKRPLLGLAHRGGAKEAPENSRTAFAHAVALGFTHIETDVRATADGVVLIHHDAHLDRTTTGSGLVSRQPYSAIQGALVGTDPIMTLEEALEEFPDQNFNIDCKDDHTVEPLIATLKRARRSVFGRILVGSFSARRLRRLRESFGPQLATSCSPSEVMALRLAASGVPVRLPAPSVVAAQVPLTFKGVPVLSPAFVDIAHERGISVHVWTIDDEDTMGSLIDMGVDGIVTDRPSVLRKVLAKRTAA